MLETFVSGGGLRGRAWLRSVLLGAVATGFVSSPASAIPSPELVIGSLSSLSQLAALLSAVIGGGALAAGAGLSRRHRRGKAPSPWYARLLLASVLVAVAAIGLNVYQALDRSAERRARLEPTLARPAAKGADGKLLDQGLKEFPYRAQLAHPRGLSTDAAAELIARAAAGERSGVVVLDIRETAETEMGSLPGARAVRFPDLPRTAIDLTGKRVLLFCHNGNRSAETCTALAERGIDCGFITGGLEKWLAEGRRLTGGRTRGLNDLRALAPYPNQTVLLETSEVRRLISEDGAILVDVRYPGEFASGHLRGAINLPIRPTPTEELVRRIEDLPARPVIVPCYDRRSCFFGDVLGLELSRRGRDFRGRYTLPWELFEPRQPPPHVELLLARASVGPWHQLADHLADVLVAAASWVGLPLALVLLAVLSRLVVAPFSLKAERDAEVAARLKDEVAALRRRLDDDRQRQTRALKALYRVHGLTPGRNLIALAFLPILALSVEAASRAANRQPHELAWIGNLADRDATLVLPAAFAVLIGAYVHAGLARTARQRSLTWCVLVPLLVVAAALLPAAADLYMVASAVLLLVQRRLAVGRPRAPSQQSPGMLRAWRRRRLEAEGVLALQSPALTADVGTKSYRLARLKALGFPVPDGLVLTQAFLSHYVASAETGRRRLLRRVWRGLGAPRIAVRSSATAEDGQQASFAGVFETVLDVDAAAFSSAIDAVLASFSDGRVANYSGGSGDANVLLQPMIAAEWSGVLFTEAPASPALMLVEVVRGTADKLVSGQIEPAAFHVGRASRAPVDGSVPPVDLAPLIDLAFRIEAEFGAPQDIEWAAAGGRFWVLQSRDITAVACRDPTVEVRGEWRKLAAIARREPVAGTVLAQSEMSEMLPRPTPLSLSLIEALWRAGGSVDLAARALGLDYPVGETAPDYHVTAFGRLYVDKREERSRAIRTSRAAVRRLGKDAGRLEDDLRDRFMPELLARVRLLEAVDFHRLSTHDLVDGWRRTVDRFITETHVEVEIVNIASRMAIDDARAALSASGCDAVRALADIPATVMEQQLRRARLGPAEASGALLLHALGHRAKLDYELAEPRYRESDASLDAATKAAYALLAHTSDARTAADLVPRELPSRLVPLVARARRLLTLKEDVKDLALREFGVLRQIALALDRRFKLGGAVFYLHLDELAALEAGSGPELASRAEQRQQLAARLAAEPALGSELSARDIERASLGASLEIGEAGGELKGTRVSGHGLAEGRAIVVPASVAESGAPIAGFEDGDIIVSPMIHPAWLPFVLRAGGVVSEVGGWLSHMSIIAREHEIAMIVGVRGLGRINSGDRLQLRPDGLVATASVA